MDERIYPILVILITIIFYLLVKNVFALSTKQCINNNTALEVNETLIIDDDGSITNLVISNPENCSYGCDSVDMKCKNAPYKTNLYIVGIIIVFIILMVVILRR